MPAFDLDRLLHRTPVPLETGYTRLDDGSLHVAARTEMLGCSGAMLEWWFRSRCDTERYIWWNPIDHVSSEWAGDTSPETHIGSEHIVVERLAGEISHELLIQFRSPLDLFDPQQFANALRDQEVSCAITARIGTGHTPDRDPTGAVLGGRLLHVGRDTDRGLVLRSHFLLGTDAARSGESAVDVARHAPDALGVGLLEHAWVEFTYLSGFLPALYTAAHRDETMPTSPW